MSMTPDRFQRLLDQDTADAPPGPLAATDLAVGRTRLRRRRQALGAGVTAAVVVLGVAFGVGSRVVDAGPEPAEPPSSVVPPSPTEEEVDAALDTCSAALLPQDVLGGPGRLMASASTAYAVQAAFVSEGGRLWATCSIAPGTDASTPDVQVYDAQSTDGRGDAAYAAGPGCPGEDPDLSHCRLWQLSTSGRLDPAVAAVRFDLWDGSSRTVETADGYFALTTLGALPDGVSFAVVDGLTTLVGTDVGHPRPDRITYLDAAGDPLAATAYDGSGTGFARDRVDGLPRTDDAYPSLTGNP